MRGRKVVLTLLVVVMLGVLLPSNAKAEPKFKVGQKIILSKELEVWWRENYNPPMAEAYAISPLLIPIPVSVAILAPPAGTVALIVLGGAVVAYVIARWGPLAIREIGRLYKEIKKQYSPPLELDKWTSNRVFQAKQYPPLPPALPNVRTPSHVADPSVPRHHERWLAWWTTIAAWLGGKPPSFCGERDNQDGTKTIIILYEDPSWIVRLLTGGVWCRGGHGVLIGEGKIADGTDLYERSTGITGGEKGDQLDKIKIQFTPFPDGCPDPQKILQFVQ